MDYLELFKESLATLNLNKVRTGLAMLGVIIGIGSVIALISLGSSAQLSVENQIKSLGSNLLTISPGAQSQSGVRGSGAVETLTAEDAEAIKNLNSNIESVSSEYSGRAQLVSGRNNTNTQVIGVTPEYQAVRNLELSEGVFINDRQVQSRAKVVILGPQVVTDLFGEGALVVGQTIRVEGQNFTIIGVTTSKGGSQDDQVFVPLTTAQKTLFGVDHLSSIAVAAASEEVMEGVRNDIGYLLLKRHKLTDPAQADFSIFSQEDILDTAGEVTATFTTLLSGIAAISLVVGGIGIMNIMLVTVTERTREIGLRKALGAKNKIVISQFLMEAVTITFIGGLIGSGLGVGASYLIANLMNLPFAFSFSAILLSFGVSAAIGVVFGWYPARKASQLEPIEALRYE